MKNINFKFAISKDDAGTGVYNNGNVRVILFMDKQCNGATAAVTDILKTASMVSFRNMDQVDRFVILKDKVYSTSNLTTNSLHTSAGAVYYSISKKCNEPVHFSSTTGAITEIRSNNFGLLYISDDATTNVALGNVRVKFIDI